MRITILNQPLGNRGDEAAHKALMRTLVKEFPQHRFAVILLNVQPDLIDTFKVPTVEYINIRGTSKAAIRSILIAYTLSNGNIALIHPLLKKFRNTISSFDAIICAPGGICMGGFMNWYHIWELDIGLKLNKPVYYWGRSIGPFTEDDYLHRLFKKNSSRLLKQFNYVSLRDKISCRIASELGVNADEVVDSAFLETPVADIPDDIRKLISDDYVVYVPNSLTWHYNYNNVPQEIVDKFNLEIMRLLVERFPKSMIVMMPQTYNSRINDYQYFRDLGQLSDKPERIAVLDETINSDIQQSIIRKSKLVIGARYHSIVFAINNNVPFISLSYEHKMFGLLETLDLTRQIVRIDDIFKDKNKQASTIQAVRKLLYDPLVPVSSIVAKKIVQKGFENMSQRLKL